MNLKEFTPSMEPSMEEIIGLELPEIGHYGIMGQTTRIGLLVMKIGAIS